MCVCVCVWYSSVVHSMHCVYTIYLCCCLPNHCFGFSASWHRLITLTMTEKNDEQTNTPVQSYWCIVNKCTEHTTFFSSCPQFQAKCNTFTLYSRIYIWCVWTGIHRHRIHQLWIKNYFQLVCTTESFPPFFSVFSESHSKGNESSAINCAIISIVIIGQL